MKNIITIGIIIGIISLFIGKYILIALGIIFVTIMGIIIYANSSTNDKNSGNTLQLKNNISSTEFVSKNGPFRKDILKQVLLKEGRLSAVKYYKDKHPQKTLLDAKIYVEKVEFENKNKT